MHIADDRLSALIRPYAAALHQDTPDTSQSPADSSARLSTPSNKTAATFNDSMFESPLLAPMAPYGSPIRFNNAGAALLQGNQAPPHSVERSPVSVPLNKRLAIKRPPGLDAPSPLKREEAKIRDMLWRSPVQEDDDTDDVDILPPEVEQLGPPSPYAVHFDKALINDPKSPNKVSDSQAVPVNTPGTDLSKPTALSRTHSQPGPNGNLNKIPTLVGPNSLPYARCPS